MINESLIGEAALFASLSADRTGRMSEIVATIQAEQDAIIRSGLPGVLVVQGGPGTGKTVVALHRAAYLLYTHRDLLARRGVLVVGPNATFLRYIEQVLPSLGENEVVLSTIGELLPGVVGTATESPEASRLKGSLQMVEVIARAVRAVRRERTRKDTTPERLLTMLWSSPERLAAAAPELSATERAALYRRPGEPWTRADVALLDEAADLLGDTDAVKRQRRQADAERAAADAENLAYTREVVHSQTRGGRADRRPTRRRTVHQADGGADPTPRRAGHHRRTRRGRPHLAVRSRDRRRGAGAVADGVADADAPLPAPVDDAGRRPRPGRHRHRGAVLGGTARPVRARPLAYRRADRELPDAGRDHGRGRRRAGGDRPGGHATGIGAVHRGDPVEPVACPPTSSAGP